MNIGPPLLLPLAALVACSLLLWSLWEAGWVRSTVLEVEKSLSADVDVRRRESGEYHDAVGGGTGDGELRIVHLTDFHFHRAGRRERRVARLVRDARPDLLLLTGDYVERTEALAGWGDWISSLAQGIPAFAVLGNHDHGRGVDLRVLRRTLKATHIHLLENEAERLRVRGWNLTVYGVDDPGLGLDDFSRAWGCGRGRIPEQTRGERLQSSECSQGDEEPPQDGEGVLRVLLSHTSQTAGEAARRGVDLILAGDTHGGQIRLPFLGAIAARIRDRTPHVDGLYRIPVASESDPKRGGGGIGGRSGASWLYVSRGIGTSHLPIRLACRPEVVVLNVRTRRR